MSTKNVEKFLNLAKTDEDLKNKLMDVNRGLQKNGGKIPDEEKFIKDKIIPLARKKGVLFTAKDFLKYADKQMSALSEEDLLNVSGGLSTRNTAAALLITFLGSLGVGAAVNLSKLTQDDQVSISAKKGNSDNGEKFSHEISDEDETKSENKGVIPKIPGLDGNAKTDKNVNAEMREENQLAPGQNNAEETAVETKQENTTAQENLRKVMQNKNVVLPNTNINRAAPKGAPSGNNTAEINIPGESMAAPGGIRMAGRPDTGNASLNGNNPIPGMNNSSLNSSTGNPAQTSGRNWSASGDSSKGSIPKPQNLNGLNSSSDSFSESSVGGFKRRKGMPFNSSDSIFDFSGTGKSMKKSQSVDDLAGSVNLTVSKDSIPRGKILNSSTGSVNLSTNDFGGLSGSVDLTKSLNVSTNSFDASSSSVVAPEANLKDLTQEVLEKDEWTIEYANKLYNLYLEYLSPVDDDSINLFGDSFGFMDTDEDVISKRNKIVPNLEKNIKNLVEWFKTDDGEKLEINGESLEQEKADELIGYYNAWLQNPSANNSGRWGDSTTSSMGFFGASTAAPAETGATSGFCGEEGHEQDVKYNFDPKTGTLTISGNGKMKDFPENVVTGVILPWGNFNIEKVIIKDGVTYIGKSAFIDLGKLTEVKISNTVKSIGEGAFYKCSSLKEITIPNSVTTIKDFAFSDCRSLTTVEIPASVTYIEDYAFGDCGNLKKVTFKGTNDLDCENVFVGCPGDLVIEVPANYKGETFCGVPVTRTEAMAPALQQDSDEVRQNLPELKVYTPFSRNRIKITTQLDHVCEFLSTLPKNEVTGLPDLDKVSPESIDALKDDIKYIANCTTHNNDESYTLQGEKIPTTYKPNDKDKSGFEKISMIWSLNKEINKNTTDRYESWALGENGVYFNEDLANHILESLDNFENLTQTSQELLMIDVAMFIKGLDVKTVHDDVYYGDRERLMGFYKEKVEPNWQTLQDKYYKDDNYEELLSINNKPLELQNLINFLDPYISNFDNLDPRSKNVLLHYIDDLLYKFYDEETNELKVPLNDEVDGGYNRRILEEMLNIARENILNQGEEIAAEHYKFTVKDIPKAAEISIVLLGVTVGAAYAAAYVTVGAPTLSGISFWGDADIEKAKAKIRTGINTAKTSATDVANRLASKGKAALKGVNPWSEDNYIKFEPTPSNNGRASQLWNGFKNKVGDGVNWVKNIFSSNGASSSMQQPEKPKIFNIVETGDQYTNTTPIIKTSENLTEKENKRH